MTALLSKKNSWSLGPEQTEAFRKIKTELTENPEVLAVYNPAAETKIVG